MPFLVVSVAPVNSNVMRLTFSLVTKRVGYAAITVLVLLSCFCNAYSNECAKIPYRKLFRDAETVFIGQVIDIRDSGDHDYQMAVKFKTDQFFKGPKQPEITVLADLGIVIGFIFHPGEKYLVYAYSKRLLVPTNCSASGPLITDPIYEFQYKEQKNRISKLGNPLYRFFARSWPF